jgi:NHL repeat
VNWPGGSPDFSSTRPINSPWRDTMLTRGPRLGNLALTGNIVSDPDGWVYVADRENHRVQIFDGNGKYETQCEHHHRMLAAIEDIDAIARIHGNRRDITESPPRRQFRPVGLDLVGVTAAADDRIRSSHLRSFLRAPPCRCQTIAAMSHPQSHRTRIVADS